MEAFCEKHPTLIERLLDQSTAPLQASLNSISRPLTKPQTRGTSSSAGSTTANCIDSAVETQRSDEIRLYDSDYQGLRTSPADLLILVTRVQASYIQESHSSFKLD